jgi:hypothetical protein
LNQFHDVVAIATHHSLRTGLTKPRALRIGLWLSSQEFGCKAESGFLQIQLPEVESLLPLLELFII